MTRNRSRHVHRAVAAAIAITLLSTGCGGNDKDGAANPTTTSKADEPTEGDDRSSSSNDEPGAGGERNVVAGAVAGAAVLTPDGATGALSEGSESVLTAAFGIPDSQAQVEGDLIFVSSSYGGPGAGDRAPTETYKVEVVQQKALADLSTALRAHFTAAGFRIYDLSTESKITGETRDSADKVTHMLSITLEDEGNGATRAEVFVNRTDFEGGHAEIKGDLYGFVKNLRFDDTLLFSSANVSLSRNEEAGDDRAYAAFTAQYELEAGGYEDGVKALERVCAGEVEGYSCDAGGVEERTGDEGAVAVVERFESPDSLPFAVTLYETNNYGVPYFIFMYTGDGFNK